MYIKKVVVCLLVAGVLASCSTNQVKLQSQLITSNDSNTVFELKEGVTIKASNAKSTELKPGTRWMKVGLIDQGVVYRTKDQVVIVNSFNVHEGYIVIDQDNVVGYYLPVEKTFVETKPVVINLSKMEIKNEI